MGITRANRVSDPRLLAALRDPRVEGIEEAIRRMDPSGHRRENAIAGRYRYIARAVMLMDEAKLAGVPAEQILALGDAFRDAAYATVYDGAPVRESIGDVLAMESVAEGEANRDTAKLLDDPKCPSRRRQAAQSIGYHITMAERARRFLLGKHS
jgi:hypothetical protein